MKVLSRVGFSELYHFKDGVKITGPHDKLTGDCRGLYGDCTQIYGNCNGLWGDCTGLVGNLDNIPLDKRNKNINDFVM